MQMAVFLFPPYVVRTMVSPPVIIEYVGLVFPTEGLILA